MSHNLSKWACLSVEFVVVGSLFGNVGPVLYVYKSIIEDNTTLK